MRYLHISIKTSVLSDILAPLVVSFRQYPDPVQITQLVSLVPTKRYQYCTCVHMLITIIAMNRRLSSFLEMARFQLLSVSFLLPKKGATAAHLAAPFLSEADQCLLMPLSAPPDRTPAC